MSNSIIRSYFETKVKAWASAQVPVIPIAFEGASFTKPTTGPFLEPLLVPNVTMNHDISGNRKTMLGIFEVKVWYPSGRGMGGVEQIVNSLVSLFPLVPKVGSISVEKTPYAEHPHFDDAGWIIVPLMILYRYEA